MNPFRTPFTVQKRQIAYRGKYIINDIVIQLKDSVHGVWLDCSYSKISLKKKDKSHSPKYALMHHPALHSIYSDFDFLQDLNTGVFKQCLKFTPVYEEIHYKCFAIKLHPPEVVI